MDNENPIKLKIPQQNLEHFSHFLLNEAAASNWAEQLPVTNTREVAQQLLAAVDDLNHCRLSPDQRYRILTALSGSLKVTLANLSKRFLHQPLIMPEEPRTLAELTDNLYRVMTSAYSLLAVETVRNPDSVRDYNPARLLCQAIQAGLEYASQGILLSFQLYQPVPLNDWLTLHQLYALAERQALTTLPVENASGQATSITSTYLQALMLGCAKPNQLSQADLAAVYNALGEWSNRLEITAQGSSDGLFVVDLDSDQPPLYSEIFGNRGNSQCRRINTRVLVSYMRQLRELDDAQGKPGVPLTSGLTLPSNMISHLIDSLGQMSMRNFNRVQSEGPLILSIGLNAAHFHAGGAQDFQLLLHGSNYRTPPQERVSTNPFLSNQDASHDVWSEANPEKDFVREQSDNERVAALTHRIDLDEQSLKAITINMEEDEAASQYPIYRINTVNVSPGGYCLKWEGDLPEEIRTGDVVSVQEAHGNTWSIAVIRWVSRLQSASTLVGLELLSPRAEAYGALIHSKTRQDSDPQRALLLPEIKLVGQPHTLLTPRAGFRERQKVTLLRQGERFFIQLTRQVAASAGYAQFDFRYIKQLGEVLAEDKSGPLDASYDSLWSNI